MPSVRSDNAFDERPDSPELWLKQKCDRMVATIVNGRVVLRDNEPTGKLPGRLLRKRR